MKTSDIFNFEDSCIRFSKYVSRVDGDSCHEWTSSMYGNGYGSFHWVDMESKRHTMTAHRFAFLMHNGEIPDGMIVDHICHNRKCVNPLHLRIATRMQNQQNMRSWSKTGYKGVSIHKNTGLFHACITYNRKVISLGYYKTPEEAGAAYAEAAKKYHGDFACIKRSDRSK